MFGLIKVQSSSQKPFNVLVITDNPLPRLQSLIEREFGAYAYEVIGQWAVPVVNVGDDKIKYVIDLNNYSEQIE